MKKIIFTTAIILTMIFAYTSTEFSFYKKDKTPTINVNEFITKNYEKYKLDNDKKSDQPKLYSIRLTDNEKNLLVDNMKLSKNYLEFGSGGSTYLALLNSDTKIVTVESDKQWIEFMKEWKIIRNGEKTRLDFYYVNIGPVGDWGTPTEPQNIEYKKLFPQYSKTVFEKFNNDYDLVFIDGRFRVACALQTILNTKNDVKIIMHDFTTRDYYHEILEFLDIVKTSDTMVLFKKKNNIDNAKVMQMYEKYKYDWR